MNITYLINTLHPSTYGFPQSPTISHNFPQFPTISHNLPQSPFSSPVSAGYFNQILIEDTDKTEELTIKYQRYWNARINIFGQGCIIAPICFCLGYVLQFTIHYYVTHIYYCTLISIACCLSCLLLMEPCLNGIVRCFAWKYIGKDALIRIDSAKGIFSLKHLDVSSELLDMAGKSVLTPSSFRLEEFQIILPWRNLFRGTKLKIVGLKLKLEYVDP